MYSTDNKREGTIDELMGFYPFDKIFELVEDIMLDGIMDSDEQQEMLKLLDAFY